MKARRFQHAPNKVLGYRRDGRPIFPIAGGSEDPPADPPTDPPAGDPDDPDLGDNGKQALDRMKAERNAARDAKRQAETDLAAARDELAAAKSREDLDKILADREAAIAADYQRKIVAAEIKAAGTGKVVDVDLAAKLLLEGDNDFLADGEVDQAAITSAIDELVTSKPYLAAQGGGRGSADGGARNGSSATSVEGFIEKFSGSRR